MIPSPIHPVDIPAVVDELEERASMPTLSLEEREAALVTYAERAIEDPATEATHLAKAKNVCSAIAVFMPGDYLNRHWESLLYELRQWAEFDDDRAAWCDYQEMHGPGREASAADALRTRVDDAVAALLRPRQSVAS
jgi:hypothetical protein